MQRGPGAREVLIRAGFTFAVNALLPRAGYWLRWSTRLRGGPLLAYVAWNVAVLFSFRQWVVPFLGDILGQAADDLEAARQELRVELGREPTRDEVGERVAATHGFATSPLMPRPASAARSARDAAGAWFS
jgi:hypothetical protein